MTPLGSPSTSLSGAQKMVGVNGLKMAIKEAAIEFKSAAALHIEVRPRPICASPKEPRLPPLMSTSNLSASISLDSSHCEPNSTIPKSMVELLKTRSNEQSISIFENATTDQKK